MTVLSMPPREHADSSAEIGIPELKTGTGLDVDLLRTLVAIAETGSFNRAAKQVFRTPSAVSMQMKKLEEQVGRPIFAKDGRSVVLTPDGEVLVGYGRRILKLADEAMLRFRGPQVAGRIRLGTPDDFASRFLPEILARFAASHPSVEVDVSCLPTVELLDKLEANEIDISLLSAGHGQAPGTVIHREALAWAGLRHGCAHEQRPLPLAVSHRGCCWRATALASLDAHGIEYRIAYSSRHYLGQLAAVKAGLAVAPLPQSTITGDVRVLGEAQGLPPIGSYEIEIRCASGAKGPLYDALADHIESSFRTYQSAAA